MTRNHLIPSSPVVRPIEWRKKKSCKPPSATDKAKKNHHKTMMNSVVKGVSKLTICKPTSSGPVDIDDYYFEVGNDDGSHTTGTATSTSRSSEESSPLSPSRICQGQSVRHSLQDIVPALLPPLSQAARRYPDSFSRWSEEQQEQFASKPALTNYQQESDDDESGILYKIDEDKRRQQNPRGWDVDAFVGDVDAFISDDDDDFQHELEGYQETFCSGKEDNDTTYEEPPLSSQTNYARQQLVNSSRYREQRKSFKKNSKQEEGYDDYDYDMDDDELCFDEVEISRGLCGYEEGFGIPSARAHEFHHLPHSIMEEDELSVASSVLLFEPQRDQIMSSVPEPEFESRSSQRRAASVPESTSRRKPAVVRRWSSAPVPESNSTRRRHSSSESGPAEDVELELQSTTNSACFHCRKGTCENEDCSGSRFMI